MQLMQTEHQVKLDIQGKALKEMKPVFLFFTFNPVKPCFCDID